MENLIPSKEQEVSLVRKAQAWTRQSLSFKLGIIAVLIIILLIPQSLTNQLILERQDRKWEAENEVMSKWSDRQLLIGPYLSVPYQVQRDVYIDNKVVKKNEQQMAYFFPETLSLDGEVNGEALHRGIFDVVVYKSNLQLTGEFGALNLENLQIKDESIKWSKAKLHFGVNDLRGIGENPKIMVNGKTYSAEPFDDKNNDISGLAVDLDLSEAFSHLKYDCQFQLKGSKELKFVPLGKTTHVVLHGTWKDPSFQGTYLPEHREVSDSGFTSTWKILHFNRAFGQEFSAELPEMYSSSFGLSLLMAVDQYQMSTRTSKYAILIIVLSFLSMFLIEVISNRKIHPFQYILIGLALVLYYTLLIALSEQIGFNQAYLIASICTILLLAFYTQSLFKRWSNMLIFSGMLTLFYVFVFVITKEQDYALLIGSIGLFIALAVTMFATKKIDWFNEKHQAS